MAKNRNTKVEAQQIFNKILTIKENQFVTIKLYNETVVTGVFKNAYLFRSDLDADAMPNPSTIELNDSNGALSVHDIYDIEDIS